MRVTFYGKAGCHLCEDAHAALDRIRAERDDLEVELVDISLDPRLFRAYGERIPVLAVEGEDVLELGFDEDSLRRALGRVGA